MPLTADNFIQEASGAAASGLTVAPTLPSGTTAGNTIVVIIAGSTIPGAATGFVVAVNTTNIGVYYLTDVAAAQTSWTFTAGGGSEPRPWYVAEVTNLDAAEPFEVFAEGSGLPANGGTLSTGTTALNAGLSSVSLAAFCSVNGNNTWAGYTNGFAEIAEVNQGSGVGLAVAQKFTQGTTGQFSTTATVTGTGGVTSAAVCAVFRAADAPVVAPLSWFLGFEWGTNGGLALTTPNGGLLGHPTTTQTANWNTAYSVSSGAARNGGYGLTITQTGAGSQNVSGLSLSPFPSAGTWGLNVRVVSATGTIQVVQVSHMYLMYDTATTKFGLRLGAGGTTSWQSGTTALNTWVWVDLRLRVNSPTFHADWRIETAANTYTDQTSPADMTGQTPTTVSTMNMGTAAAQTAVIHLDDVCATRYYAAYPLGPQKVVLLKVDPAGTPSVSGTTGNFSVFTANGTLAAWNATNARNAVDEVPPTISASADGVVQTAVAASDYIQFPMETYTCVSNEYINAVRVLCPEWGGTGTGTGTFGLRGWDGTTETTLVAASASYDPDSLTAVSASHPRWISGFWSSTNGWTQAELDAASVRVGFSTDATPDMGVHAVYLEVAIGKTRTTTLFGDLASIEVDPTRLGVVSATIDAPSGYNTDLVYEEAGSPTTVPVTGGTSVTEQINAVFEPDVNYISAMPAAEPDPID